MPTWCDATIIRKKVWTEGLFTLTIETSAVEPFEPGQFLQLGVYREGQPQTRDHIINRPYSVASPHGQELEFFIVEVPDGELTPRLNRLDVGDSLLVNDRGAGRFTLEKSPAARHLWLIATGTGLAPYVAMLRTQQPWDRYEKIILIHGVRKHADLAYTDELNAYRTQYPGRFELIQSLTRETAEGTLRGRIPELFASGQLEQVADCELLAESSAVLLCGNPAMLESMDAMLAARQMTHHRSKTPGQIVLERYW